MSRVLALLGAAIVTAVVALALYAALDGKDTFPDWNSPLAPCRRGHICIEERPS